MNSKVRTLTMCAVFAAITAVLSQISFSVGVIPFSMGIFAVMLCGGMLEPLPAFTAQLVYLALGAVGIPVFAGFTGGFQSLVGYTGGFLMAYPFVALVISLFRRIRTDITAVSHFFTGSGFFIGLAVCYLAGSLWYAWLTKNTLTASLAVTVLPFIVPDIIKAAVACCFSLLMERRIGNLMH